MRIIIITQKVDEDDDVLGFFHTWIDRIAKKVDSVFVICLAKGKYRLPKNVTVVSLGKENKYPKLLQALLFYFYLIKSIWKANGIFVHMAPEYVRALYPVNIFFKRPVIMWYAHIKVSKAAKWAIGHVDRIFTPSRDSFASANEKVISTGHGINVDDFRPSNVLSKDDKIKILSISRISKVKRIETLIEAVKVLVLEKKFKKFKVLVAGEPARPEDYEYKNNLLQKIKSYGIEEYFDWLGGVPNRLAPKIYEKADVFVRMQGGGGYGKTELEAMSCGVPVVLCTDVYSKYLPEYFSDIYFKEDDSNGLAEAILKVSSWEKTKREKYSADARKLVMENHNINILAEKIAFEFKKIISK